MINWAIWVPVIISVSAGGYAYLTARNTNKTTLQKASEEVKVDLSKTNNEQSIALFQQYQKMNESLQTKFDKMQTKLETIEEEFRLFRVETEKEKAFMSNRIEELEEENEELKEENHLLLEENNKLKGDKQL